MDNDGSSVHSLKSIESPTIDDTSNLDDTVEDVATSKSNVTTSKSNVSTTKNRTSGKNKRKKV